MNNATNNSSQQLAKILLTYVQKNTHHFSLDFCQGVAYGCYLDDFEKAEMQKIFEKIINNCFVSAVSLTFKKVTDFQDLFYPKWRENKSVLLYANALAGEVGEVCGVIAHLEGGGTNNRNYRKDMVLHQCVDTYVQIILLLERYGFTAKDFMREFNEILDVELPQRLAEKQKPKHVCCVCGAPADFDNYCQKHHDEIADKNMRNPNGVC
ncbi:MAG: MazG-like family protein [archaeon]